MNILIVEDDENVRIFLRMLLSEQGFAVEEAADGKDGLARTREHRPDLIISDGLMPVMDGFQFLQALKADPGLSTIPFIFLSAVFTGQRELDLARSLGADAFLVKPQPPAVILEAVRAATGRREAAPPAPSAAAGGDPEFAREYSRIVAALLEEKVRQLETTTAELELTQKDLRESEAIYRGLFENSPQPMWVYDLESLAFRAVNDAAISSYGFTREEFLSMTIKDIRPPEDVPALLEHQAGTREGFDEAGTWKHRKKDGTIIDVEITSHTLPFLGRRAKLVLASNVTERARLEKTIRLASDEWRDTFDAMTEAVALLDPDGRIMRCNKSMTALAKRPFSEIIGHACEELCGCFGGQREECPFLKSKRTLKRETAVFRQVDTWFEASADPIVDSAGTMQGVVHILQDITGRKGLEDALRESERKFRNFFDSASDSVFILDMEGNFIDINRTGYERLGYTKEEMLAKHVVQLDPPEFAAKVPQRIAQIAKYGQAVFESAHIKRSGAVMPVEVNSRIIDFEGRKALLSVVRDITERKKADEMLKKREAQLAESQRIAGIGSWERDLATNSVLWSKELFRIFGLDPERVAPSYDILMGLILPEDREIQKKSVQEAMRSKKPYRSDFRITKPDGTTAVIHSQGEVVCDEAGRAVLLRGTAQDITERQQLEDALKAAIARAENEKAKSDSIIAAIGDGITIQDRDFRILYQNESARKMIGDHVGELCYMAYEKRAERCEGCGVAQVFKDGGTHVVERAAPTNKGLLHVEITASPLRDSKGNIIAGIEVVRNITTRKNAEEILRKREFQLAESQRIAGIGSWERDLVTNEVIWSDELFRIFGLDPGKTQASLATLLDLIIPEDREGQRLAVAEAVQKRKPYNTEYRILKPDGRRVLIHAQGEVVCDDSGRPVLLRGTAQDITERRKAEESLQAQQRFTENLIQNSAVATFVVDTEHKVLIWNRACEELTGVPAAGIVGTKEQWKPFYGHERSVLADIVLCREPEKLELLYSDVSASALLPDGLHAEGWYKNLNGRDRYIVFDAAPIRDGGGTVIATIETLQDITERKLAEDSIRKSEERYRNVVENAFDMIQSIAPNGRFLYVNPAWLRTMGYSTEELHTMTVFDILHPSCRSKCSHVFSRVNEGTPIEHFETQYIAKNGRVIDIEGSAFARIVDDGVEAIQCLLHDVTERKRLEEQIYRAKQDWEDTFNSITDMVTVHDADYNIILANKAAEKILNLPLLERMKDRKCFSYYHGTDQAPEGCPSCGCLQTGAPASFEIFEPHLNMFIEIRAIPRFDSDGNLIGLIHVVRDITERKKSEEALTTYSRELTSLNTASNTLMLTTNLSDMYQELCNIIYSVLDLKMVWLGVVDETSFAVRPAAFTGAEDGYLSTITVTWDDSPTGSGPTGMAIKTREPRVMTPESPDYTPWREQAKERGFASSLAVPLMYARDKCVGALNFYSDKAGYFTPDRVNLCQIFANHAAIAIENARLVEELEERVQERTRALEDTNVELQTVNRELVLRREEADAASRSKTDFLANMSHELRTPLNAIMGFSEIMLMNMAGPVTDKQREFLNDISKSGNHLLSLINDILDLSKIEAGKVELELGQVVIGELVSGSLMMFKEKALKHAIRIATDLDASLPEIIADHRLLKQVLVNLLSNAFKFTPDGGSVRVSARLARGSELMAHSNKGINQELSAKSYELDADFIEISVSDTGVGITPEHQQKLFQPFQQIDSSLTRKHAGTGLGLSLCRRFVELHGGRIWVESEPGKGSTFRFVIPVRQA